MGVMGGLSTAPPAHLVPAGQANGDGDLKNEDDPHLRSTQDLGGYHIQAGEAEIGHVTDVIIDDKSWTICHLLVETGHWFAGKEIAISPKHIDRISYKESKVFVNIPMEAIKDAPEYHAPPLGEAIHYAQNFK
jgi:sporulation protein YlmC with PRC-barrel domain